MAWLLTRVALNDLVGLVVRIESADICVIVALLLY